MGIGAQDNALADLLPDRRNGITSRNHEADFLVFATQVVKFQDQRVTFPALGTGMGGEIFQNELTGFLTDVRLAGLNLAKVYFSMLLVPAALVFVLAIPTSLCRMPRG